MPAGLLAAVLLTPLATVGCASTGNLANSVAANAALAAGRNLPYSCRAGQCRTCRGTIVEGTRSGQDDPDSVQIIFVADPDGTVRRADGTSGDPRR